jgi:hypothetical protein
MLSMKGCGSCNQGISGMGGMGGMNGLFIRPASVGPSSGSNKSDSQSSREAIYGPVAMQSCRAANRQLPRYEFGGMGGLDGFQETMEDYVAKPMFTKVVVGTVAVVGLALVTKMFLNAAK